MAGQPGPAMKLLSELSAGSGPASREAQTLLEQERKEVEARIETIKALPKPEALQALRALQQEYAGSSLAESAKKAEEQIGSATKPK